MVRKAFIGLFALGLIGLAGCEVYGPAVVGPGFAVGPAPVVVGGFYPYRRYGYYGYYGWRHRYWR